MMRRNYHIPIAVAFLVLFVEMSVHGSTRYAINFGGNCNEGREGEAELNESFSNSVGGVASRLKKLGWKVSVLYDHQNSQVIDKSDGVLQKNDVLPAGKKELLAAIDKVIDDASNTKTGKVQSDTELLMSFETHGSKGDEKYAHGLCLADGTLLHADDPDLISRLDKAKSKGIKLGFLDDSCYGGGTIPALKKFGCVISSQNAAMVSTSIIDPRSGKKIGSVHNSLIGVLDQKIQSGTTSSLDDVYLRALWLSPRESDGTILPIYSGSGRSRMTIKFGNMLQAQSSDFPESSRLGDTLFTLADDNLASLLSERKGYSTQEACSIVAKASNELESALGQLSTNIVAINKLQDLCKFYFGRECPMTDQEALKTRLIETTRALRTAVGEHGELLKQLEDVRRKIWSKGPHVRIPITVLPLELQKMLPTIIDDEEIDTPMAEQRWSLDRGDLVVPIGNPQNDFGKTRVLRAAAYNKCGTSNKVCEDELDKQLEPVLDGLWTAAVKKMSPAALKAVEEEVKIKDEIKEKLNKVEDRFVAGLGGLTEDINLLRTFRYFTDASDPNRKSRDCRDFTF